MLIALMWLGKKSISFNMLLITYKLSVDTMKDLHRIKPKVFIGHLAIDSSTD